MSTPAKQSRHFTPEEYLAVERIARTRSEYLEGVIYAMVGSSLEHSIITFNVSAALGPQLRGTPCRGFSSDMKVRTGDEGLYAYPDLTIVCGKPILHDDRRDVLVNPKVIIEVLSPSTEAYDRGKKFKSYQKIESLTDYILIAQDEPQIDHYFLHPEKNWVLRPASGLDAKVEIQSIACTLSLADVYDKVAFRPAERIQLEER